MEARRAPKRLALRPIYAAQTSSAIVNSPIEASSTLWLQRAIDLSMFGLQRNVSGANQVHGGDFVAPV